MKIKDIDTVKLIIVVTSKDSFIADYPSEIESLIDGYNCEDNYIDNIPEDKGIYECKAKFWFKQGYCDGYPADGENEWSFEIINNKKLY